MELVAAVAATRDCAAPLYNSRAGMALRYALFLAAVSTAIGTADPVTDALASTACNHGNQLTWTSNVVGAFLRDAGFSEAVRVEAAELGLTGERLAELGNLHAIATLADKWRFGLLRTALEMVRLGDTKALECPRSVARLSPMMMGWTAVCASTILLIDAYLWVSRHHHQHFFNFIVHISTWIVMPVIIFAWALVVAIYYEEPSPDYSLSLTNFFTLLLFFLILNIVSFMFFELECWKGMDAVLDFTHAAITALKARCKSRTSRTSHVRTPRTPAR